MDADEGSNTLLLGREPDGEPEIADYLIHCHTAPQLRARFLGSPELRDAARQVERSPAPPAFAVNLREGVIWAFRLILGREPNDEEAVAYHVRHSSTIAQIRSGFLTSAEFMQCAEARLAPLQDVAVIEAFRPFCTTPGKPGSWNDFMGVSTRCEYLPAPYQVLSETFRGAPGSLHGPMHDTSEWVGTLRAVREASQRLVVVELGAGWAPWLVAGAKAAAKLGIAEVHLVGVEGAANHIPFMRQHFFDNDIDPDRHRLLHGVVGLHDGSAFFPRLSAANEDYGAMLAEDETGQDLEEVPCYSLATVLDGLPVVDVLHCDIQGPEGRLFEASTQLVDTRVRRVVIGTHSRAVEDVLLGVFSGMGWELEHDKSCAFKQAGSGEIVLVVDGVQVWRNRKVLL